MFCAFTNDITRPTRFSDSFLTPRLRARLGLILLTFILCGRAAWSAAATAYFTVDLMDPHPRVGHAFQARIVPHQSDGSLAPLTDSPPSIQLRSRGSAPSVLITEAGPSSFVQGVVIKNLGRERVDIGGWGMVLRDRDHRLDTAFAFVFPPGSALLPGQSASVAGAGRPIPAAVNFEFLCPVGVRDVWEYCLQDSQGTVVDSVFIGVNFPSATPAVFEPSAWSGSPLSVFLGVSPSSNALYSRIGRSDHDRAGDWRVSIGAIGPFKMGTLSSNLFAPFESPWKVGSSEVLPLVVDQTGWIVTLTAMGPSSEALLSVSDNTGAGGQSASFAIQALPSLEISGSSTVLEGEDVSLVLRLPQPAEHSLPLQWITDAPDRCRFNPESTLPVGASESTLLVRTVKHFAIEGAQTVSIRAHIDGYADAVFALTVVDRDPPIFQWNMPDQVVGSGNPKTVLGTLEMSTPLRYPVVLNVMSDDPAHISVWPKRRVIQPGVVSIPVLFEGLAQSGPQTPRSIGIHAQMEGVPVQSTFLTWVGNWKSNLVVRFSKSALIEGVDGSVQSGEVSISEPWISNLKVMLTGATNPPLQTPVSLLIPQGATSVVFNATFTDDLRAVGTRNVSVQATAPGFLPGNTVMMIIDNDPDHFDWSPQSSFQPQLGLSFPLQVVARDRAGGLVNFFNEEMDLYLQTVGGERFPLGQQSLRFTNGVASASVRMTQVVFGGFLVVSNSLGRFSRGPQVSVEDPGVPDLRFSDVVAARGSGILWGGVIQQGSVKTNQLVTVDPISRSVTAVAELTSPPFRLALNSDETSLFVATRTNGILHLNLAQGRVDASWPYVSNRSTFASTSMDLAAVPGHPDWLLAASAMTGVRLYKQGQSAPLIVSTADWNPYTQRSLFVRSDDDAYVVRSAFAIQHVRISDQGVEPLETYAVDSSVRPSEMDEFQLYDPSGGATSWTDFQPRRELGITGVPLALPGAGWVLFAGGDASRFQVSAFDRDGFRSRGTWFTRVLNDAPVKLFLSGPTSVGALGGSGRLYPVVAESLPVARVGDAAFKLSILPENPVVGDSMSLILQFTNLSSEVMSRVTVQTPVANLDVRATSAGQGGIVVTNGWMTWLMSNVPPNLPVQAYAVVVPGFEGEARFLSRCYPGGTKASMLESMASVTIEPATNPAGSRFFQIEAKDFIGDPRHHRIWFSAVNLMGVATNALVDLDLETLHWGDPITLGNESPGLLALSADGEALWTVRSSGRNVSRIHTPSRSIATNLSVSTTPIRQIEALPGAGHSFLVLDSTGKLTGVLQDGTGRVFLAGSLVLNSLAVTDTDGGLVNEWRVYSDLSASGTLLTLQVLPTSVKQLNRFTSLQLHPESMPLTFARGRVLTPSGVVWDAVTSQIVGRLGIFGSGAVAADSPEGRFYSLASIDPFSAQWVLEAFDAESLKSMGSAAVTLDSGVPIARFRSCGNGNVGVLSGNGRFRLLNAGGLNGLVPEADLQITGTTNTVPVPEGSPVSFRFTIENLSERTAQDIKCRVVVPTGGQWISAALDGVSVVVDPAALELVVRIPLLRRSQVGILTGVVRLPAATRTSVIARVQHAGADPNPANNEASVGYQSEGFLSRALTLSWSGENQVARMGVSNETVLILSNRLETALSNIVLNLVVDRGDFVSAESDGVTAFAYPASLFNPSRLYMFVPVLLPSEAKSVRLRMSFPSAGDALVSTVLSQGGLVDPLLQVRRGFSFLVEPGASAASQPAMRDVVSAAFVPSESLVWAQFKSLSNCLYRVVPATGHITPGFCLDAPILSWCLAEDGAALYVVHADPFRLRRVRLHDGGIDNETPIASPFDQGDTVVSLLGAIATQQDSVLIRFEDRNHSVPSVLRVYDRGMARLNDAVMTKALGVGAGEVRMNPEPGSDVVVGFHFVESANQLDLIQLGPDGPSVLKSYANLPTTHRSFSQPSEDFVIAGPWVLFSSGFWLHWQDETRRPNAAAPAWPLLVRKHGEEVLMGIPQNGQMLATSFPSGDSEWVAPLGLSTSGSFRRPPRLFAAGESTVCMLNEITGWLTLINDLPQGPAVADLAVFTESDRMQRSPADLFVVSWGVLNKGGWDARGLELRLSVPLGVHWIPANDSTTLGSWALVGNQLVCHLDGVIRAKASLGAKLYFSADPGIGTVSFVASVSSAIPDPETANNVRSLDVSEPILPQFSLRAAAVIEQNAPARIFQGLISALVSGYFSLPIEVDLVADDDTAIAGRDYLFPPQRIVISPSVNQRFVVPLSPDLTVLGNRAREADRTFYLRVVNITNAVNLSDPIPIRILDDDRLELAAADVSVSEAGTDHGLIEVPVFLSQPMPIPIEVSYSLADATARAGSDYIASSGRLLFAPGVTQASVKVRLIDDQVFELPESFYLTFDDVPVWVNAVKPGVVTITDNDPRPELRILSIERVGEVTVIRFPSSPDRSYVVEETDHLVSPQWSTVSGMLNGTGSAIRVEIAGASSASAGFIRIREL